MHATRIRDLAAVLVVVGVVAWVLILRGYGSLPKLSWFLPVAIIVLALIEGLVGFQLRDRIRRTRGNTPPVEPLAAARMVALAKASAYVGAALTGAFAGVLGYTVPRRDQIAAAQGDMTVGIVGIAGSLLLVSAALWLEYCCRTPDLPEDRTHEDVDARGHR